MIRKILACLLVSLLAIPASVFATDYFVAQTGGLDARSCMTAQSIGTPKQTITSGITCLSAGDRLFIRTGTYAEKFYDTIPPGSSWGSPVTLSAYIGDSVTIQPSSGDAIFLFGSVHGSATQYIIISGMTLDAVHIDNGAAVGDGTGTGAAGEIIKVTDNGVSYAHHIRVQDSVLINGPGNGVLLQGLTGGFEFLRNSIHDNATNPNIDCNGDANPSHHCPGHGIYHASANSLFDGNDIYSNSAGPFSSGMQVYSGGSGLDNNIIRNNKFHGNTYGNGLICCGGSDNLIYNNVFYGGDNLSIGFGAMRTLIANNSFTGVTTNYPIQLNGGASSDSIVQNNILYGNLHDAIDNGICCMPDPGPAVVDHNLTTNPGWVGAPTNMHLSANDGGGCVLATCHLDSIYTTDADGVTRTATWDRGAYEYVAGGTLAVTTPTAGTIYTRPSSNSVSIAWTSSGITGNVDIWYSLDNGSYWYPIITVAYNTSPYVWTATVPASTTLKVCVEQDASDCAGSIKATSSAFTLKGAYFK